MIVKWDEKICNFLSIGHNQEFEGNIKLIYKMNTKLLQYELIYMLLKWNERKINLYMRSRDKI